MMNGGTVMEVDTGLSRLTLSYFIDIERGSWTQYICPHRKWVENQGNDFSVLTHESKPLKSCWSIELILKNFAQNHYS